MKRNYAAGIRFFSSFFLIIINVYLYSQYPEIKKLNLRDPLFSQLQDDIQSFYRATAGREPPAGSLPVLQIFRFQPETGADLFSLAASLNLPYETLGTLNRLNSPAALTEKQWLLIPNQPGLFLPALPDSDLEDIMTACREQESSEAQTVTVIINNQRQSFYFFSGSRFHAVERAFFLKILFRFPLARGGRLTSEFGRRKNPFSGKDEQHNGIDIAASVGTPVLAAREGKVLKTGYHALYGLYILLQHAGNYQSLYGHLSKICITLAQEVASGDIIGEVGSSGRSTGPHLHFEVIKNGDPRDPLSLFR